MVFEPLIEVLNGEPKGVLATDWRWSNVRTLELHLRRGVRFHDGTPFDAEVVRQNFEVYKSYQPARGRTRAFPNNTKMEVISPFTIRFIYPHKPGLPMLSLSLFPLASSSYLHKYAEPPIAILKEPGPYGTGPFILHSGHSTTFHTSAKIVLKANPYYWDKRFPKISSIILVPAPANPQWAIEAVKNGQLDLTVARYSLTDIDVAHPNIEISKLPGPLTIAVFNQRKHNSLWLQKPLRRALNLLINRDEIIDHFLGGNGRVIAGLLPPSMFGSNPDLEPYTFDPTEGARILRNFMEKERTEVHIKLLVPDFLGKLALIIRAQLKPFGISMSFSALHPSAFFPLINVMRYSKEALQQQDWDILIASIFPQFDSFGLFSSFFSKDGIFRWSRKDNLFDEVLERVSLEQDIHTQKVLLQRLEKMLHDNLCCLFLYDSPFILVRNKRVGALGPEEDQRTFLRSVRIAPTPGAAR
ncbi:MAG: ABC transporter substrate-binding protein [Candidatus Tectomicrobia bacterium]|nr:ABC transporter substrate-binding protein [Candidatus Tectomicrobia bacterium]